MVPPRLLPAACLLILLGLARPAPAGFVSQNWTSKDGLPVISLVDLAQTQDGYLWISTSDGLVRFDGVRFTVYRTSNTPELPTDRFSGLATTRDGTLYLRTEGFGFLRREGDRFVPLVTDRMTATPSWTTVLHEDDTGAVWMPNGEELVRLEAGKAPETVWRDTEGEIVRGVTVDAEGRPAWITLQGLYRREEGRARILARPEAGEVFVKIDAAPDGSLWVRSVLGLWRFGETLEPLLPPGARAPILNSSLDGDVAWVLASNGLFRLEAGVWSHPFEFTPDKFFLFVHGGHAWYLVDDILHVDGDPVLSGVVLPRYILVDDEGNYWLTTHRRGLFRFSPSLFEMVGVEEGLPFPSVYAVYEDRPGTFLIGTLPGLSVVRDQRVVAVPNRDRWIRTVHRDRQGTLWVGGSMPATLQILGDNGEMKPSGLPDLGDVLVIHEDRRGALWFGAEKGLFRLDGGTLTRFGEEDGLPAGIVRSAEETDDGLWFGTNGGGVIRHDGSRFTVIDTSRGLSGMIVRGIHEDRNGALWIGTEGMGLNRLVLDDSGRPVVTRIGTRDGLYDDVIHGCLEDDHGRLWMSSNRGIFWVRRDELEEFARGERTRISSVSYTESDGMRNREANGGCQPVMAKASDGRFWFATVDGVAIVDPDEVPLATTPLPTLIEDVRIGREHLSPRASGVRLPRGQRTFEIDFTATSFRAPEDVRFRYRLEGVDRDWVEIGGRRTAYFNGVPPGEHAFQVQASLGPASWGEPATLALVVPPYFHETLGFRLLLLLLVVATLTALYRYRTRVQRLRLEAVLVESERRRRAEEALRRLGQRLIDAQEDERRRVSRDLHDDVSQRLALLNIEISVLGQRAGQDVSGLESIAQGLAEELRRISHNLHPGKIEQLGAIPALQSLCREASRATGLEVRFRNRAGKLEPPHDLGLSLYRITQEALRNAWKHSGASQVTVTLDRAGDGLSLEVTDDGRGFRPDEDSESGLGLMSMGERARAAGGVLTIDSRPGEGTRIRVRVPLDPVDSAS